MTDSAHAALIAFWCDTYFEHVGVKYPFSGGKDGATVKWLRGLYSDEDIKGYMTAFFDSDDDFIQQSGFSLSVFRGCLPKMIALVAAAKPKPDMHGHVPPCRTRDECNRRHFEEVTGKRAS